MKITLIIILMNLQSSSYSTTSASNSGTSPLIVCGSVTCANVAAWKKIAIPMPDLKSCLDARHQVDDYTMLISAACSAE